jgi:hypothetical protein
MRLFTFLMLLCFPLFAQTETPVSLPEKIEAQVKNTAFYRSQSKGTVMVGLELFTSWVPFKLTAGYTYIFNKDWSLEAEFARGHFGAGLYGFNLASVNEYRYSLLARRYLGNSFHWIFGLYKDDFRASFGSDYLDDMSDTSIDDLKVEILGATLGVGNRWQWKNGLTMGMDWVRTNIPIFDRKVDDGVLKNLEDVSDHDRVKKVINRVVSVPSFTLFGLYLGYTF